MKKWRNMSFSSILSKENSHESYWLQLTTIKETIGVYYSFTISLLTIYIICKLNSIAKFKIFHKKISLFIDSLSFRFVPYYIFL